MPVAVILPLPCNGLNQMMAWILDGWRGSLCVGDKGSMLVTSQVHSTHTIRETTRHPEGLLTPPQVLPPLLPLLKPFSSPFFHITSSSLLVPRPAIFTV